jgi:hypothetical protein
MEWYEAVALGCAGGTLPDLVRIVAARHDEMPAYLRRVYFWISLGLLAAMGGIVAYFLKPARAIDTLALGYSAPGILSKLLADKDGDKKTLPRSDIAAHAYRGPDYSDRVPNPFGRLQKWWSYH